MNSEILEVLREVYPEEPSLGELVDELNHTLALLNDIRQASASGDITRSNKFNLVLGNLSDIIEHLAGEATAEGRISPIVKIEPDVMKEIDDFRREWDIHPVLFGSMVNSLIRMSVMRINSGEENFKVWVGEGDTQRMMEIRKPAPDEGEKEA